MKRAVSLPTKLFIAYGVLLVLALVAIVIILESIFNYRIEDEVYFRIHNGGKTVMNAITADFSRLDSSLKGLRDAPLEPKEPALQRFCENERIDFLCFGPVPPQPETMRLVCGGGGNDLCRPLHLSGKAHGSYRFGIDCGDGTAFLEAEIYSKKAGGFWKGGIFFSEKYIDKLRNLSGMEILYLPRKPGVPAAATLPSEKLPFRSYEELPGTARELLESFLVYSFKWTRHGEPYEFIFYPLINPQDEITGVLGVGFSLKSIKNANRYAYNLAALFIFGIMTAFLALGVLMAHHFLEPLHHLKQTVASLLNAEARQKLLGSGDEVHFLGESFKHITDQLTTSIDLLAKAKEAEKMAQRETLLRLAIAAEYKDQETAAHILRLSRFCEIISRNYGLDEETVGLIRDASAMHDIGKIGIPDAILQKKGALTPQEFELMKAHTKIGTGIFKKAHTPLYETCRLIALTHHEKWDGSGYPQGLKGEEIPLAGRIVAVADVFDALTSERYYKPAFGMDKSLTVMRQYTGTHFDPKVMEAFWKGLPEIQKVIGLKAQDLRTDLSL